LRTILDYIRKLSILPDEERMTEAKELGAPFELVNEIAENGRLPVVLFCAGGVATPADAALVMQLGAEGVFVGSGVFKSEDPAKMARAIVDATTYFNDPDVLAKVSRGLGEAMRGLDIKEISEQDRLAPRGW
jgi:pyridoxal 5'-phosphate synthase pdxS subunit